MLRWFLIGLMSLVMTITLPIVMVLPPGLASTALSSATLPSTERVLSIPPSSSTETPQALLHQGLAHYEAAQFFEATQQWQKAYHRFETESDRRGQALTLSYLALAYQQLGQLDQAGVSLRESLQYLGSLDRQHLSMEAAAIYAKVLNTQGKLHWLKGELEDALTAWQASAQAYLQARDGVGVAIAQINQARVLQHLGLNSQAKDVLQQVYQRIQQQPDTDLKSTGLRHLGSLFRQIGDLNTARTLLQDSLSLAAHDTSLIFLELGNTDWAMANRLQAIGRQPESQQFFKSALAAYQKAIDADKLLSARLNLFRLLIDRGQVNEAFQQLPEIQKAIDQSPLSRTVVYTHIHLAESLLKLVNPSDGDVSAYALKPIEIAEQLSTAIQQAQALQDKRAEAYALGQLGRVYEQTQQWVEAQSLTQQALLTLETIQAPEIRYRLEWQLGRLSQHQGNRSEAIRAYEAAVESLQRVRDNLLSVNADVQFSFRDNVEPVYRQYIELLLAANQTAQSKRLEQAIQTVDRLQLAELENYLGCTLAQMRSVEQAQDAQTAIVYPMLLSDRLVMIVQLPGASDSLKYYETRVSQATAEATLSELQTNLANPGKTPEVIEAAQKVYDWMIRPLEADLAQTAVQTLVFVPDGALRNIPMSVLHDGEQYLIEKGYAVAIAPRLQMFTPGATHSPLKVTTGGVGISQEINETHFPPIAKLREELEGIADYVETSDPLIDEAFTTDNIRRQLETGEFSAIHWKTHGVFSSDPQETYVVAYNEQIIAQDLNDLIWLGSRGGSRPLELVVLSACETAQGDNRAVLGLAGLAARTGTRSVLSTLWIAQDTPNTAFMVQFYKALAQPNVSKAKAVRQAQLSLINEYGYTTPYIWSNYVLIGNWL